jgi:hypothetical protein
MTFWKVPTFHLPGIIFFVCLSGASLAQGSLEIYQLSSGQADAAILVTRQKKDGPVSKIVVIDAGLNRSNYANMPIKFLRDDLGCKDRDIDIAVVSHYHADHIQGFLNYWNYINAGRKDKKYRILQMIIPGGAIYTGKMHQPSGKDDWDPMVDNSATLQSFLKNAKNSTFVRTLTQVSVEAQRLNAVDKLSYEIDRIDNIPITMKLVAGLGRVGSNPDRTMPQSTKSQNANNDNLAWVIEFGKFRYYTGGDLGGITKGKKATYDASYINQEKDLAEYMRTNFSAKALNPAMAGVSVNGHVCVMKVNHHGSSKSNTKEFLNTLRPTVFVTSTGDGRDQIPKALVLNNMNAVPQPISYDGVRGVFFTDLVSQQKAHDLFHNKSEYIYNNHDDVLVKVVSQNEVSEDKAGRTTTTIRKIDEESAFTVTYVNNDHYWNYYFQCHE